MLFDFAVELAAELFRALFIDALSDRVRRRIERAQAKRRKIKTAQFYASLITRHQKRLLHKLHTRLRQTDR